MSVLNDFVKRKDFLICIDSDGCAIDSMNVKHKKCFGPCMVKEWELEQWEERLLERWDEINLYTLTRGINRFAALSMALEEADRDWRRIDGIRDFSQWTKEASKLSNQAVKQMWEETGKEIFVKALSWSEAVNRSIAGLPKEEVKPFEGAAEGVKAAHQYADVAIVSSANEEAVTGEWRRYGLMESVDVCLTQKEGSKAYCIGKMLEKGYAKNHVLMIGDAPGDLAAADENGVLYYPVLVNREMESWNRFTEEALELFLKKRYEGSYQMQRKQEFIGNLDRRKEQKE